MNSLLTIIFFALGAVLASFAGVISERLNTGESWTHGRSKCNSCNRLLTVLDLVPIVSWLAHKGACRTCKARVPYHYALAELSLGVIFAVSYTVYDVSLSLLFVLAAFFLLTIIVLYDLRHTIVPLTLAFLFVLMSVFFVLSHGYDNQTLSQIFLTAGLIGLGFFLLHVLSKGLAMGLGDAPIALALSLLAGTNAVSGLLFSFWTGAVIGIFILVSTPRGHRMGIEVPFVPFLAAGYLLALFTQWNPLLF